MLSQEIKKTKCEYNGNPSYFQLIVYCRSYSYVQHLIRREKSLLKRLLVQRGGYLYVSGSSKNMPTAVKEAVGEAIDDNEFVEEMVRSGKYFEETWS